MVMVVHCCQSIDGLPATLLQLSTHGSAGVQLFYMLSAITLFRSLDLRRNRDPRPFLDFFIRRFFRIAPLFYAVTLFYLWWYGLGPRYWLGNAPRVTAANIAATFAFVNGFNPRWINSITPGEWSIAVEMTFYLAIPVLFLLIRSARTAAAATLAAWIATRLLTARLIAHPMLAGDHLWTEFLFLWFPNQLPIFLCGILLFFLTFRGELPLPRTPRRRFILAVLLTAASLAVMLALSMQGPFQLAPNNLIYEYCLALAALIIALWSHPLPILVNPVTTYLGLISYSLYLTHYVVLEIVLRLLREAIVLSVPIDPWMLLTLRFVFGISCAVMVATITHRFIEIPGQQLGRRVIGNTLARYPAPPGGSRGSLSNPPQTRS
jgi:peptidoglycan/LPS O-acetylase OafA/YrhL